MAAVKEVKKEDRYEKELKEATIQAILNNEVP
jgi:hypothetical protein